jgi:putative transposase
MPEKGIYRERRVYSGFSGEADDHETDRDACAVYNEERYPISRSPMTNGTASRWIGVDLNSTGHIAVVADPVSGKIVKLGKRARHIHIKYGNLSENLRKNGEFRKVKRIKNRERRILRDLNHKVSKEIVTLARSLCCGIKLEKLYSTRQNERRTRPTLPDFSISSGSFYQLQQMVEAKAKRAGVPVAYVNPAFTSKRCSRCGGRGKRSRKQFLCPHCGHVDHADANAAFNIASASYGIDRLHVDRDACNGSTDTPERQLRERGSPQVPGCSSDGDMSDLILPDIISWLGI